MSEGFGIPIAEAQACGCPVITTDFSAMTELTVNGIATEPAGRFYQPLFKAWQAIPSVERITAALETIYGWSETKRRKMAATGVAHMQREYNWDAIVANYWKPMLERVERADPINTYIWDAIVDATAPPNGQLAVVPA
jgi:glycosyltransferase involved in cell wall biosynthesis